jgi:signal transduction histidine kinase
MRRKARIRVASPRDRGPIVSLRFKLSLAIIVVLGAHFAIDEALKYWAIYPRFVALERERALNRLQRCRAGLSHEIETLSAACLDRPAPRGDGPAGGEGGPSVEEMLRTDRNVDLFVSENGSVIWRNEIDVETHAPLSFEDFAADRWPTDHVLLRRPAPDKVLGGVMRTQYGPLLVAARFIAAVPDRGQMSGTRVVGRLLTQSVVDRLRKLTDGGLKIGPAVRTDRAPQNHSQLAAQRADNRVLLTESDDGKLCASVQMAGIDGTPALWLETSVPRDVTRQGHAALLQVSTSNVVLGVAAITLLLAGAREMLVAPLGLLTKHASAVGASGDLGRKLDLNRRDEIGVLARAFDDMLQHLAEYRTRLADTSRQAGMAEVASGVLHNVGNVLNSANVTTDMLHESVRNSRVRGVSKAAGLLREHAGDLATFIESDPRGRQLPDYLDQLGDLLTGEQSRLLEEIGRLKISLDHMNQIVQAQRELARPIGTEEPACGSDVVESAVAMLAVGFDRHGIELVRDIAPTRAALLDRQRLMQVLINLLTNAKDALAALPVGMRRMAVRVRATQSGMRVEVADTGIGIERENLTRIFTNGFSTKESGGGYGLHYCALVAKEMGGELTVTSDGPGQGATAVLDLPLKPLPTDAPA